MATGDDALAAGMPIMTGTEFANTIDTEINLTRDFIAQRTSTITPVSKGGTGASNAATARSNLDVPSKGEAVANDSAGTNVIGLAWTGSRVRMRVDGTSQGDVANTGDITGVNNRVDTVDQRATSLDNIKVNRAGDTISGNLFFPNSSAATSGFTVAYINGDGRLSRGSSSRRYKKNIRDAGDLGDLFAAPLREYRMRVDGTMPDDPTYHVGYIAEELLGTDMERFVVLKMEPDADGTYWPAQDAEGNPVAESIDFISLLMAQTSQLAAELAEAREERGVAADRITDLEARLDRLEQNR